MAPYNSVLQASHRACRQVRNRAVLTMKTSVLALHTPAAVCSAAGGRGHLVDSPDSESERTSVNKDCGIGSRLIEAGNVTIICSQVKGTLHQQVEVVIKVVIKKKKIGVERLLN